MLKISNLVIIFEVKVVKIRAALGFFEALFGSGENEGKKKRKKSVFHCLV